MEKENNTNPSWAWSFFLKKNVHINIIANQLNDTVTPSEKNKSITNDRNVSKIKPKGIFSELILLLPTIITEIRTVNRIYNPSTGMYETAKLAAEITTKVNNITGLNVSRFDHNGTNTANIYPKRMYNGGRLSTSDHVIKSKSKDI